MRQNWDYSAGAVDSTAAASVMNPPKAGITSQMRQSTELHRPPAAALAAGRVGAHSAAAPGGPFPGAFEALALLRRDARLWQVQHRARCSAVNRASAAVPAL